MGVPSARKLLFVKWLTPIAGGTTIATANRDRPSSLALLCPMMSTSWPAIMGVVFLSGAFASKKFCVRNDADEHGHPTRAEPPHHSRLCVKYSRCHSKRFCAPYLYRLL